MAVCERCRHDNPAAREHCARCGWYLRWELTGPDAFDARSGSVRLAVPTGTVAVTLEIPGHPRAPEDPLEVALPAGDELTLAALVRDGGASARRFDVTVEGLPVSWWTVEPRELEVPAGDPQVIVRLHPPRSALAEARRWPFWVELTADDGSPGGRSAIAGLTLARRAVRAPRRRRTQLVLAAAAVVLALVVFLATRDSSVTVPDITGLANAAQARQELENAGLRLDPRVGRHVDPTVAPGTVIRQIPDAGADAEDGDPVRIVVAAAPKASRNPPAIRPPDALPAPR